jgi:hypothetical protein
MSKGVFTRALAPTEFPPAGKVYIYAKTDGRFYWMDEFGVETGFRSTGAGTGDLLADGSVPLTADWDVGVFKIVANQLESDVAFGTPPFIVASATVVPGLNAALLDNNLPSAFVQVAATTLVGTGFFLDEDNMAADDDTKVASQQSIKAYVDSIVVGGMTFKGTYDADTNTPDLDTSPIATVKGDMYICSVAGTFFTTVLEVGDALIAEIDSATVEADWSIIQGNIQYTAAEIKTLYESNADTNEYPDADVVIVGNTSNTNTGDEVAATEILEGVVERSTQTETDDGADTTRYMSPANYEASVQRTKYVGQNLQTGTTYELVLTDAGKMVEMSNAGANVLTIPANASVAFPVDTRIDITQGGAGLTSVTITTDTLNGELVSQGQYKGLSLWKKSATVWVIYGGTT